MSRLRCSCILAIALLFAGLPAAAQVGPSGGRFTISGRVLIEGTNTPVDRVVISLRNFTDMAMGQTTTDAMGQFSFAVPRGTYYLSIRHADYAEVSERVEVSTFSVVGLVIQLREMPRENAIKVQGSNIVSAEYLKIPKKARDEFEAGMKVYHKDGNLLMGLQHFQKALEHDASLAAAHYWIGMIRIDQGQLEPARDAFLSAIAINDKLAAAYFPLGATYLELRDPALAAETLRKGLALNEKVWQGHYELARASYMLRKLDEAEKAALSVLELKPDMARAHLLLANIHFEQQRDDLAMADAEEFLRLAPDDPMAPQIRARLDEMRKAKPPQ